MAKYPGVNPAHVPDFYGLVPTATTRATMGSLVAVMAQTRLSMRSICAAILEQTCQRLDTAAIIEMIRDAAPKYDARLHSAAAAKSPAPAAAQRRRVKRPVRGGR